MMTCETIRDLLMTDYVDNELDARTLGEVKHHLAHCAACASLEATVREMAVAPFKKVAPVTPSPRVWERIEGAIHAGRSERRQRFAIPFPRGIFVGATVAMFIAVFALFAHVRHLENASLRTYIESEMAAFAALEDPDAFAGEGIEGIVLADEKYSTARNYPGSRSV